MRASELDSAWFYGNPDREYRLRRQTLAEIRQWPVPPAVGLVAWCIIRRLDGELRAFGIATGETWDDYDEELGPFFEELGGVA